MSMDKAKRAFILAEPDSWANASIKEAMQEMQSCNAGTVSMALAGKDEKPVFALAMITGEHTQEVLAAIDAVTDDERSDPAAILQRIRLVMARHLSPIGSSKHEAIGQIADILAAPQSAGLYFDLVTHLYRQREFSEKTFGPGARTAGVLDHIRKELIEIEAEPTDLAEWADLLLLALDGAWRAGHSPEEIAAAINGKQGINERRNWPDWRTADPSKAIEHVRS